MDRLNCFNNYEWLGEFFYLNQKEIKDYFPGNLTYAPENGLSLEFFHSTAVEFREGDLICGVLSTGDLCTLFYAGNPEMMCRHYGTVSIVKDKLNLSFAVFGKHLSAHDSFAGLWMDFTNFQEFCCPTGFAERSNFAAESIQKKCTEIYDISVVNSGKFHHAGRNTSNIFYSTDINAEKEIKEMFDKIIEKYPYEISRITDISWVIEMQSKVGVTAKDAVREARSLEKLFSLMLFDPVRTAELSLMERSEHVLGKFIALPVLASMFNFDGHKVSSIKKSLSHHHMHINLKNTDLPEVIFKWALLHKP